MSVVICLEAEHASSFHGFGHGIVLPVVSCVGEALEQERG